MPNCSQHRAYSNVGFGDVAIKELPDKLYTVAQVREMDALAISVCNISAYELMQRAGKAAFNLLIEEILAKKINREISTGKILIVCGAGNNGGDGYVIARLALQRGLQVTALAITESSKLQGAARQAVDAFFEKGGQTQSWQDVKNHLSSYDIIVDAILGTGLQRNVDGQLADIINNINQLRHQQDLPVLAIDIPSGINADTGAVMGVAVQATQTISFIGLKQGLFLGDARDYCGQLYFDDLQIPEKTYSGIAATIKKISNPLPLIRQYLPPRKRNAYKNSFGHVLIIGGDQGMNGAVIMAGSAALRTGAGLVTIATHPEHAAVINATRPELICYGVKNSVDLKPLINKATVIAIGPGLGQTRWAQDLLSVALETKKPLLVDADALNLLANQSCVRDNWILTPHPGEAARLLATINKNVQDNRPAALKDLVERYKAVIVLKGAGSLIGSASPDKNGEFYLCDRGNPGMATAGMGDILTGIISSLIAQGLPLTVAARLGVLLHASAGDTGAADKGERGLLAMDLLPYLQTVVNA